MTLHSWQLIKPLDAVVFDCDATLSQIEGINYLAEINNVLSEVAVLTEKAMSSTGINPKLYEKRLSLVKPTLGQVLQLAKDYYNQLSPGVQAVLSIFKKLGKVIYLFSAGVNPAVEVFGTKLGFLKNNIYAVDLTFDDDHHYLDFDHHSLLTMQSGKKQLAELVAKQHDVVGYVGDGMNDAAVVDSVARFIGYGGVCYREKVRDISHFYITTRSLLPLLPLCLTEKEYGSLSAKEQAFYQEGIALLAN